MRPATPTPPKLPRRPRTGASVLGPAWRLAGCSERCWLPGHKRQAAPAAQHTGSFGECHRDGRAVSLLEQIVQVAVARGSKRIVLPPHRAACRRLVPVPVGGRELRAGDLDAPGVAQV